MRQSFGNNRLLIAGTVVVAALLVFTLVVSLACRKDPSLPDYSSQFAPPGCQHILGTDSLGRDLLARVASGLKVSLLIGILAASVSLVIGVAYGSVAGYFGGRTDYWMMRLVDIIYGLPFMFFVIILIVLVGRNIYNLFIALGAVQWLTMSRIVRSEVLSLKKREFVEAARSIGISSGKIIIKHIIPNLMGPVLAYACLLVPRVIMEESFLSFLGLGIQPPQASLGTLINDSLPSFDLYWWTLLAPTFFLVALLFGMNLIGEGLRSSFDPKS